MKLEFGDKIYLQPCDVEYILHHIDSVPKTLIEELFASNQTIFVGGNNFDYSFARPENIEWLKNQPYILSFSECMDIGRSELKRVHAVLSDELKCRIERSKHGKNIIRDRSTMDIRHKLMSLNLLLSYRKHDIDFAFPEGYVPKTSSLSLRFSTRHSTP